MPGPRSGLFRDLFVIEVQQIVFKSIDQQTLNILITIVRLANVRSGEGACLVCVLSRYPKLTQ